MVDFKDVMDNAKVKAGIALAGASAVMVPAFAFAEDEPAEASAVESLATTVATQGTTAINSVLPIMGGLLAAGIVITLGVKFIKKLSAKAG